MSTGVETVRVLHVDDEPDFGDMVATYLERADDRFDVRTVASPDAGLGVLAEEDVDCIVSDYDMPHTNGIEFLERVREGHPDLPFILYTGKGSEEVASEAISAGVTDYLQKESGTSQYTLLANRISNAVEQHRSSQQIAETEKKLSELAEKTDDVLFMVDGDWNELLFVNSAFEEIWGGSIEDLEEDPRSFLEFVHPDDRADAVASMAELDSGESSEVEYRIQRPDGERRWVRGDTQPILDDDGNVVRIVGQVRDVTRLKERELHLETIIDNLPGYVYRHAHEPEYPLQFVKGDAEAVTGYTTEELEEDVFLAQEIIHPDDRVDSWSKLIEDLEARGRFDSTYRIITKAGDVRWIRDQGQLIEDPVTGEEMIEGFITDVSDQIRRERELRRQQTAIDEGLDALRDGWDIEPAETVDLREVVEAAWSTVAHDRAGCELSVDDELPTVGADADRLSQLLENLFHTAVQRSREGVTVSVGRVDDGFYVEHDGPALRRDGTDGADDGASGRGDGTGLGLWIVEGIAEGHGWVLDAVDGSDGGTRFEFIGVDADTG